MSRIFALLICFLVPLFSLENIALKDIVKELNTPTSKPIIMPKTKKFLEQTHAWFDYQGELSALLAQKIHDKKDLKIRIFGDSHIAGDFLSHQLRGLLFESNAFGFVYPLYPAYHQNITLAYESENITLINVRKDEYADYPMGGIVAQPSKLPARIKLTPKIQLPMATLTKIIFKSPHKKEAILIQDAHDKRYKINAKRADVWQTIELNLQYPFEVQFLDEKVELGGFFIYQPKENRFVENIGINGAKSDIWRKWEERVFMQTMRLLPADLVILCYGSNDALYDNFNPQVFLKDYGDLIDKIKITNPDASILLIAPPTVVSKITPAKKTKKSKVTYKITKNFQPVKKSIHELAEQKHTLLFDMDDFMNESGGKKKWEELSLAKLDVHLLPLGYRLMADKIFYELERLK
uniref:Uncharacterized protein n=1 Tax=uncultured Helicobacter sp. TaxID=175537 RepID=A0A650EMF3_9HELI|nr:hypothetical protein Helico6505_1600 [uncultured Helicobacter sp.]